MIALCLNAGCSPAAVEQTDVDQSDSVAASAEPSYGPQPGEEARGDAAALETTPPLDSSGESTSISSADPFETRPFQTRTRRRARVERSPLLEFHEHYKAERYPAALSAIRDVLRERPDDPELLYLLALTYRADGDSHRAEPSLNRILEIDPQHVPARKLLCIILTEDGRCAAAAAQIDQLVKNSSADANAYVLRAAARLRCGDVSAAEQDAEAALRLDPTLSQALLVRGAARLRSGQIDAARADLEAARRAGVPDGQWQPLAAELDRTAKRQAP